MTGTLDTRAVRRESMSDNRRSQQAGRRLHRGWYVLLLGALVLAACGNDDGATNAASGDGAASADSADEPSALSIGAVPIASADQKSNLILRALADLTTSLGWTVDIADPAGDIDRALSAVENYVQQGVDLIIIVPIPTDVMASAIQAAYDADIPVLAVAGGPGPGVQVDFDTGRPHGGLIAERVAEDMDGEGKLLVMNLSTAGACILREEALMDAIEGTDIEVTYEELPIPGTVEAAQQFTRAWLSANPSSGEPLGIWACWDEPALAAVTALREAGRDGVFVYGNDGSPPAFQAIQAGDMTATAYLPVDETAEQLKDAIVRVMEEGVDAEPRTEPLPAELVTTDNIEEFLEANPDALDEG